MCRHGKRLTIFLAIIIASCGIFVFPPLARAVQRPVTTSTLSSDPLGLSGSWWERVALEKGLDPYLLYAIALVEARRLYGDGFSRPWPWAINDNTSKVSHFPHSKSEAVLLIKSCPTANLDIGLMQINYRSHRHRVTSPEELLDCKRNIAIGADILKEALDSSPFNIELAVGHYHSWNDFLAINYGASVLRVYHILRGR